MSRKWNSIWEKILSVLLTANIAVMGWLWTSIARLADRLDKHIEDRSIHAALDRNDFVGRREFDTWRESDAAAARSLGEQVGKLEQKIDKTLGARGRGEI